MMRKDVKLGFAIGGVLLAVLIVYVLVISGGDDKSKDVSLVTSDSQSSQTDNTGNKSPAGDKSSAKKHGSDSPAPAPTSPPKEDPFKNPTPAGAEQPLADSGAASKPQSSNGEDKWAAALNTGKLNLPVMMTKTPDPAPLTTTPVIAEANKPTPAPSSNSGSISSTTSTPPIAASNSPATVSGSFDLDKPATQPSAIGSRSADQSSKHTVQPGETYSSIASSVYGSAAYWPHISRANPTIDARKLKAGMVINLPPASEVKADSKTVEPTSTAAESGGASKPIDTKTEYRVVAGDSLNKISQKLYGKPTMVEKIYELNKSTIGENPAHLKLGMILKLPEAPSATASR
jgi:nucleoid-associated protein YgaU